MTTILDPHIWFRASRGRRLNFYATDDEIRSWLFEGLLHEYSPYSLVGADNVKVSKREYQEEPFQIDLEQFPSTESNKRRWKYWIKSAVLSHDLELRTGQSIDIICATNGLICLQHGLLSDRSWGSAAPRFQNSSSIAITDKVANKKTGEMCVHNEYYAIFQHLRKLIKKSLYYSTIQEFPDGQESEDTTTVLMTEGAVASYENGTVFEHKPGRRIKGAANTQ